eukprot:2005565-Pleurochrysis_carterae.AAC.2
MGASGYLGVGLTSSFEEFIFILSLLIVAPSAKYMHGPTRGPLIIFVGAPFSSLRFANVRCTVMAALRKVYKLSARSMGRAGTVISTDTGHTIRTDVPKHMGGDDIAPQPVELLLAALVGVCSAIIIHVFDK